MSTDAPARRFSVNRFQQYALLLVVYLLGVILFGAWVRVTGSGAGCGESWPTCNGQVLPRAPSVKTLIEFTHRVTSGLLGPLILVLPIWAWRKFPAGHLVRSCSLATLVLVILEAAIGAGLVLGGLVDKNDSTARALAVALHLGNTLLLMACAALTVGCSGTIESFTPSTSFAHRVSSHRVSIQQWRAALGLLVGLALVACLGAITALGDTLFPVGSQAAEQVGSTHYLVQLRVVHPLVAIGVGFLGLGLAGSLHHTPGLSSLARAVSGLTALQLLLGMVNIALHAPGWLQLFHLLLAQLLWMSAVLLAHRVYCAQQVKARG